MLLCTPEPVSLILPVGALLQGSVPNKFYVHNDIFRYEDEVFGDSEGELDEGEKNHRHGLSCSSSMYTELPAVSGGDGNATSALHSSGAVWGAEVGYGFCCWNSLLGLNPLRSEGCAAIPYFLRG